MHAGNDSDRAGIVIPLFTSASSHVSSTFQLPVRTRMRILPNPHEEGTEVGITNWLAPGNREAWFWEDAVFALLGSSGIGAIAVAFRFLA
jgi:hypothetical protein